MLSVLMKKLKEAVVSVLPVSAIVFLLNLTPLVDFSGFELLVFLIATVMLILGIALFNLGADLAMTPMGEHTGSGLTKSKNPWILLSVCFLMGVFITVAEPDLSVLASQVKDAINGTLLIVTVGIGVGLFLVLAVIKIITGKSLSAILQLFYLILFATASLVVVSGSQNFMALAFDSGGVTTGPITVPFIMALGVGIASTLGGKNSGENSFGLIALCSLGPMLAVLLLGLTAKSDIIYTMPDYSMAAATGSALFSTILGTAKEVAIALGLIVVFFLILQIVYLKLPKKKLFKIAVGLFYTFFGLVIFLSAATIGFMPIGYKMGVELAQNHPGILVLAGLVLGMVVVLAEPAVHVLNNQVEDITGGTVSKLSMVIALSIGVGLSIALSMIRIIYDFNILYYLVPGYIISLALSFFVPPLYTAIAFDSGGVASGPLSSSFILPLAIGACFVIQGTDKILLDAFGVVAMIAMTPLITIQLLGFKAIITKKIRDNIAMKRILNSDDEQIIDFI